MGSLGEPTGRGTEAGTNHNQLLSPIANTVVSNKEETFLHDLISNSSAALDKIKASSGQSAGPELSIRLVPDEAAKTLTVVDVGIGMTRSDLFRHLGTVARAGTTEDGMLGGLGIRSAYRVADKVAITTKHGGDGDDHRQYQYVWVSRAGGSFAVRLDHAGERLGRGTKLTLFLKESHLEYLAERRLRDLVSKYSESIRYPIYLWAEKATGIAGVEEVVHEWVQINKRETPEEYASWSKSVTNDREEDSLAVKHFSAAGQPKFSATISVALFKHVTMGKCLGSDHFVGNCRAPTRRCLLCFRPGHIARGCAPLHEHDDVPGAPHRRLDRVAACAPATEAAGRASSLELRSPNAAAPAMLYKARVCVEGVPAHARRLETVAELFAGGSALVESLDRGAAAAGEEAACVCAWVWTRDPDAVAKAGTLLIQEPRGHIWESLVHSDLRLTRCPSPAAGPPLMLAYEVIIHLDRVYDYSHDHDTLWPRCRVFPWHLGVLDGAAPPPPPC